MRKSGLFCLIIIIAIPAMTQQSVGIGSPVVHSSAMMDVSKNIKGVLIPRLTQLARLAISNPAEGLLVYDTTLDRLYQYQDGNWLFMLNNTYWTKSSANFMYSFDSIGIGNGAPTERLDVSGNIRGRTSLKVSDNVNAGNSLIGDDFITPGNIVVNGSATVGSNISTLGDVAMDGTNPILQLKSSGDNKAFMQLSGDDLRLGTNSGNTTGKIIIRMNGTDIISIDTSSSLKVLVNGSGGNLSIGAKLSRQIAADDNMIAVASGRINADGTVRWMSQNGTCTRVSAGVYEIQFFGGARISARSSIQVTAGGTAPRLCSATYITSTFLIRVRTYDPVSGAQADTDFNFIVHDPLNL